jgi:hypothetical protein
MVKGAYTLSRAKNNASGAPTLGGGNDEDGRVQVMWNMDSQYDRNYAVAGFDRTHNVQIGFLYQLPWQTGPSRSNLVRSLVNDWQVNGVFGAFSGAPFTVLANPATLNTPQNAQTADLVGDVQTIGDVGANGPYYDVSAWAQPQGVKFGNTERNQFRGPGGMSLDLSVFRAFPMGQTRKVEFRLEASNVTNRAIFANPVNDNLVITSPSFMRVTQILSGYAERQIRLGLRFSF